MSKLPRMRHYHPSSIFNMSESEITAPVFDAPTSAAAVAAITKVTPYEYHEISLEKGTYGLGFTIAGGVDNPHVGSDTSIYITKLNPGGAAALDKRLRVGDIILKVNATSVVNVWHSTAVDAFKRAGNRVVLSVKRKLAQVKDNQKLLEVELRKGPIGLGFTIAGGIGNQHIPGDNGIYVTKVMEGGAAAAEGRIEVGDRLVCVKNFPGGEFVLDNCTHEEAVNALKLFKDKVVMVVSKGDTRPPFSLTMGRMQSLNNSTMNRSILESAARRGLNIVKRDRLRSAGA